jgi:hypothetical protein
MNRHLGVLYATSKEKKFETRGTVYHKSYHKTKANSEESIDMHSIVKLWGDTHDKYTVLKRLGKMFKQINKAHDDDLIK